MVTGGNPGDVDRADEEEPDLPRHADLRLEIADKRRPWTRMLGLGIELASFTLGLAGIGYAIDSYRGHETPYATAAGTLVGFSFGMFRFIQRATAGR